jgi:Polyketide cyclase / dehydrase and lipid transport
VSAEFEVIRTTTIAADPARVHALVNDFHEWVAWSPWEGLDPAMTRTYSGPHSGTGAHYAWNGNRKAGAGAMEITASAPERIDIELAFMRPMDNTQHVAFVLVPRDAGTDVTWRMTGELKGFMGLVGRVLSMDRLVGKDFEKGLAQLKAAAEQG